MPAPNDPQLDAVAVSVVAFTAVLGGEAAKYIGPYLVILAAAIVGAIASLMRRPDAVPYLRALALVCWLSTLSLLLTGSLAAAIEAGFKSVGWAVPSRYLLVPVSMCIAAIGHDWPTVGTWVAGIVRKVIQRRAGVE